ncbi:MAG: class I SAM-dependent methyltransferase [Deltaproteobacteria bacterium]|nr:class I SAM-dependent methyltransferase [Deltaproteobacteria bacterium]
MLVHGDAARIWMALSDETPSSGAELRGALSRDLADAYDCDDVSGLLADLEEAGVVERADAPIELGYDAVADDYDARPPHDDALFARIAAHTRAAHWEDVLEVGCGTGVVLERLASHGAKRLHGIDVSRRMLARAAERVARAGFQAELQLARAEALPFEDDALAMIVLASAHGWVEMDAFWAEARRVLRPDGRVVLLTTLPDARFFEVLRERGAYDPSVVGAAAATLAHDLPHDVGLVSYERLRGQMTIESPQRLAAMARSLVPPGHPGAVTVEAESLVGSGLQWPQTFEWISPLAVLELLPREP